MTICNRNKYWLKEGDHTQYYLEHDRPAGVTKSSLLDSLLLVDEPIETFTIVQFESLRHLQFDSLDFAVFFFYLDVGDILLLALRVWEHLTLLVFFWMQHIDFMNN